MGEDLVLQLLQLRLHLLSLKEPSAASTSSEKELADPGRELRLHLGAKERSQAGVLAAWVEGWRRSVGLLGGKGMNHYVLDMKMGRTPIKGSQHLGQV